MAIGITVSDDDIDRVERLLGLRFDEERRDVLKCLDSRDIQACPGSGKTTCLIAKLAILLNKLPAHKGICVLSHTNVARIEIEQNMRAFSGRLFRYPHYIGTIQSFVDKFLTIPAMIERFGIRPCVIGDEAFEGTISSLTQHLHDGTKAFLRMKTQNSPGGIGEFIGRIRWRQSNFPDICVIDHDIERDFGAGPKTNTYQDLAVLKEQLAKNGVIAYHDAFSLAYWYLKTHPEVAVILASRFPVVFIDEMQDTDTYQLAVLEEALGQCNLTQRFGDCNQAIYHSGFSNASHAWRPQNPLTLSTSHRFGARIAARAECMCATKHKIIGCANRKDYPNVIFLFDDQTIVNVIPAFAELVLRENLRAGPFKAIAAVGRPNSDPSRYSATSYWPTFKKPAVATSEYKTLFEYFVSARAAVAEDKRYRRGAQIILSGLLRLLKIQEKTDPSGHYFSASGLLREMDMRVDAMPFFVNRQVLTWIENETATSSKVDWQRTVDQVFALVGPLLNNVRLSNPTRDYVAWAPLVTNVGDKHNTELSNCYTLPEKHITVEINTIHKVKGQTHEGTLVLETFNHEYDLQTLIPYLINCPPSHPGKRVLARLPLIYVGMTRPREILCLAMHRDHIQVADKTALEKLGWSTSLI